MTADDVRAIVEEDRREWAALCAALDARRDGPLHDPESPAWTARDVYTHLARLMEGSVRQMEDHLAGRPHHDIYEGGDEDAVNARVLEEHSHLSFNEARARALRAFEGLIDAIESVPLERWDKPLEFYASADGADHYRGHRSYLRVS